MCPGRWFAFDFLWISVASILSVYRITEATDVDGQPKDLLVNFIVQTILRYECFSIWMSMDKPVFVCLVILFLSSAR